MMNNVSWFVLNKLWLEWLLQALLAKKHMTNKILLELSTNGILYSTSINHKEYYSNNENCYE